jgi:DNA-binding transcriptional regulator LsrR (DeoR family)
MEIAAELAISQSEVSKCVRLAEEKQIVRRSYSIDPVYERDLAREVREAFPYLQDVRVLPLADLAETSPRKFLERLGHEAARYIVDKRHHGAKIGISCGNTVRAFIDAIGDMKRSGVDLPVNCLVYPLITLMRGDIVPFSPIGHAFDLVRWLPCAQGKAFQLPKPNMTTKEKKCPWEVYKEYQEIQHLQDELKKLDYYVYGIGFIDPEGEIRGTVGGGRVETHEFRSLSGHWGLNLNEALQKYRAVGEAVYQPFDAAGNLLVEKPGFEALRNEVLYVSLDDLRERAVGQTATVVAVAGGVKKHAAILAALRGKFFNILITDGRTAEYILANRTEPANATELSSSSVNVGRKSIRSGRV